MAQNHSALGSSKLLGMGFGRRICGYDRKNAAIDILRQEKRVEPLPATWDPPAREESQDEYQYLVSLIQTLPDTYRRILELKYVEEYSNREIAKRLKMNEATVATRARRGKMMLRERLDKEGFYEGL